MINRNIPDDPIATINEAELCVRMCEAAMGIPRPANMTAEQALEAMEPRVRATWRRAGVAVMEYLLECINDRQTLQ
jgi:hypothetical protein